VLGPLQRAHIAGADVLHVEEVAPAVEGAGAQHGLLPPGLDPGHLTGEAGDGEIRRLAGTDMSEGAEPDGAQAAQRHLADRQSAAALLAA
jgi:hypothetical protein